MQGLQAHQCACAADRTGHFMMHTLCGRSLMFNTTYCIEYFDMYLLMTDDGYYVGAIAPNTEDGTAMITVLATWIFMQYTGDGNAMAMHIRLANQDTVEFGTIPSHRDLWCGMFGY